MKEGLLPNLAKLRAAGGFSPLGTSIPPQSPVAWANFINGAGPGSHGIFDFIHRHPQEQCAPFYSAAETVPGEGGWEVGDHRLQLDFWPFNHKPPATVLRRQGVPFWDYLDAAGVPSTFYDLPSNYPPSPSHHGHHRCICGMGTPDMLGTYGTYQYFAEDGPAEPRRRRRRQAVAADVRGRDGQGAASSGRRTASSRSRGRSPSSSSSIATARPNAAVIEIQGQQDPAQGRPVEPLDEARLRARDAVVRAEPERQRHLPLLPPGGRAELPALRHADQHGPGRPGACRSPSRRRSSRTCPKRLGPFYTTGFQEDYKARNERRLRRRRVRSGRRTWSWKSGWRCSTTPSTTTTTACCSSTSPAATSSRTCSGGTRTRSTRSGPTTEAKKYFGHVQRLYQKLDAGRSAT